MQPISALDIKASESSMSQLRFNDPVIDEVVGSIRFGGITEISGEAGCGKSQICLFLALRCALQAELGGVQGSTAYLNCGEGEFPVRRLSQMAKAMAETLNSESACTSSNRHSNPLDSTALMGKILIERIDNFEQLLESVVSCGGRTDNALLINFGFVVNVLNYA